MAIFCGTDIVSVERIRNSINQLGETFLKRIYTDEEISYCESRRMSKFQSYAARFAAKEAAYKALSPETSEGVCWHDAEVLKKNAIFCGCVVQNCYFCSSDVKNG